MPICLDCSSRLPSLEVDACASCGWRIERTGGVAVTLSSADRDMPVFGAYRDYYEQIAADDLEQSIQSDTHLDHESELLLDSIGAISGLDLCDIGVGQGRLLDKLRERGPRSLTGVDVALPYLQSIRDGHDLQLVLANAEHLPFEEDFDTVVATDVLEHVLNVGDFLLSAHRALRPGGRLVVRVPYRDDLLAYSTLRGYRYPFVHLRAFGPGDLQRLLGDAGFEVGSHRFSGFYLSKLRPFFSRSRWIGSRIRKVLVARYGDAAGVTRIDPRVGRLLMRPNVVTVVARRPAAATSL